MSNLRTSENYVELDCCNTAHTPVILKKQVSDSITLPLCNYTCTPQVEPCLEQHGLYYNNSYYDATSSHLCYQSESNSYPIYQVEIIC